MGGSLNPDVHRDWGWSTALAATAIEAIGESSIPQTSGSGTATHAPLGLTWCRPDRRTDTSRGCWGGAMEGFMDGPRL